MNDLHARLHDLADSVPEWDDPLPAVLRASPDQQRRWSWTSGLSVAAAVLAVLLVAGGAVAVLRGGANTRSSSAAASAGSAAASAGAGSVGAVQLPICGAVPTPSGRLAGSVRLVVSGPRTAREGSALNTLVTVQVLKSGPTVVSGLPWLTVLHAGSVVAQSPVPVLATTRDLVVGSSTLKAAALELRRCSQSDNNAPLVPGEYQVVAALGYHAGADSGYWVSAPITVTVR